MRKVEKFELDKDTVLTICEEPTISSHHVSLTVVIDKTSPKDTMAICLPLLKKDAWSIGRSLMNMGYEPGAREEG